MSYLNECFSNFKDGVSDGVLIGVKSDSNHNHCCNTYTLYQSITNMKLPTEQEHLQPGV